jgi:microcompartment protein CcmL/EutN
MDQPLGLLETTGYTPAMVALDVMAKASPLVVLQAEVNDFLGICIKVLGPLAGIESALEAGREVAREMGGQPVVKLIAKVHEGARAVIESKPEYNPLIQQDVVHLPTGGGQATDLAEEESIVADNARKALGFIETQGFTAVFEAIDQACKAANVEVVGKEKLGGGYVTVVIQGDVAAVKAAVEAGREHVEGLGTLIAAHVIARPSEAVVSLLPSVSGE